MINTNPFIFSLLAFVLLVLAAPLSNDIEVDKRDSWGRGTWFDVGLGACGEWNQNSDSIVAISADIYGDGGNCNEWVQVTNSQTGATAYGMTRDKCPSCAAGSLDMSPGLFQQLGDLSAGVLQIEWHFMGGGWSP